MLDVTPEARTAAKDAFRRHGVSVRQLVNSIIDKVGPEIGLAFHRSEKSVFRRVFCHEN